MVDYRGAGSNGEDPKWKVNTGEAHVITIHTDSGALSCVPGERNTYDIDAAITEELVSCKDAKFFDLYQRTLGLANNQASTVTCAGNCKRSTAEIYRAWSCTPGQRGAGAKAKCEVILRVGCGLESYSQLDVPSLDDFGGDYSPPHQQTGPANWTDFDPSKSDVLAMHLGPLPLECPSTNKFYLHFHFRTEGCSSDTSFDFGPYVHLAEDRVKVISSLLPCGALKVGPGSCFSIMDRVWESWDCSESDQGGPGGVRVIIAFTVTCGDRIR